MQMSNSWTADIQSWTKSCGCSGCRVARKDTTRSYNETTISKLLQDEGWDPSKYTSSMKTNLHEYLTKWYFLAEKKMPIPATSLRRNPGSAILEDMVDLVKERRQTTLSDGHKIRTSVQGIGYISYIWNDGVKSNIVYSNYIDEAMLQHNDIIEEVLDD